MAKGATNRPRLLLIAPTALDFDGRPIRQRRLYLPGLTLPMLAAATPAEVDVQLLYETTHDIPYGQRWDLVGLTGMGSGVVRAWQIADRFRARGTTVVLGGIGVSLGGAERSLAHADAVVVGEAEEIWPRLLADFAAGRMQPVYGAAVPPAIDRLPTPRYDLLDRSKLGGWLPVQATRGCPFHCRFCSVSAFFAQRYRKRPVEQVIADVQAAKRQGVSHIAFIDDNIGVDWQYCRRLWEALIAERIIWMSQCSLHIAEQPGLLALAHRSGCRLLSIGIESTNAQSLASVDKAWNRPERYLAAVDTIRRHGIDVSTEMMIGLDADGAEVFERTYQFLMAAKISVPRVHIMTPVPGTPLFDDMQRDGRLLTQDFSRFTGGRVVFSPAKLSAQELQEGYWKLLERLFSWRSILQRNARNHARLGAYMRALVLGTNLHYRRHVSRRIAPGIV